MGNILTKVLNSKTEYTSLLVLFALVVLNRVYGLELTEQDLGILGLATVGYAGARAAPKLGRALKGGEA